MNHQDKSKAVQYWAGKHLVVSGNHCQLIDSYTHKNLFQFDTGLVFDVIRKCYLENGVQYLPAISVKFFSQEL